MAGLTPVLRTQSDWKSIFSRVGHIRRVRDLPRHELTAITIATVRLARRTSGIALQHQAGVSAAETETIGHDAIQAHVIHALAYDGHAFRGRIELIDIGGSGNEVLLHHQQRINGLIDASRAQGMAGK